MNETPVAKNMVEMVLGISNELWILYCDNGFGKSGLT